jgi:excinuclease ABC subunit A
MDPIRVRGARTHNLRNLDLDLPRAQLTVLTGPSGSGKSSLAFDTLYAEGQRRYVESLSSYARQFLQVMDKPDVDRIDGLAPAIAIEQRRGGASPRSTVGTATEIHDHLRLLFARAGVPHCPNHPDQELGAQSVAQMVDILLALPEATPLVVMAPLAVEKPAALGRLVDDLRTRGFVRFRVDGLIVEGERLALPAAAGAHRLEVVVDRLRVQAASRTRLAESLETALRLADGRVLVLERDGAAQWEFSTRRVCPICGTQAPQLEPRLFSFNNPAGACPECNGLGQVERFDTELVVAHPQLSLAAGAIEGWDARSRQNHARLRALAESCGVDLELAWERLPESFRNRVLQGDGAIGTGGAFAGILVTLERRWRETQSPAVREALSRLRARRRCPECGGTRLRREARNVYVGRGPQRRAIHELESLPLAQLAEQMRETAPAGAAAAIAAPILAEIRARLGFLVDVGLGYLTLDRAADSLSGGEAQRIRLASQIGSGLTGVLYVLDEPSIGLHARDNLQLIATLKRLRDLGNTLVVVEHDEETIRAADYVVDMGPGAGTQGGRIVAQGTPAQIERNPDSLTGDYLAGRRHIAAPVARDAPPAQWLILRGASGNNLRNIDLRLPVGRLVCVTGVSGSGKSTLVSDTLAPALARRLQRSRVEPDPFTAIEGAEHFEAVVEIDQAPIGRTPRSNPATFTGIFAPIRELYAATVPARERGYGPGRFSFNVAGGRCETCEGDGLIRVEMHFLPDVYVLCESCGGRRYNRETLEILYKERNIAESLDLTVDEALAFFAAVPALSRRLKVLAQVGLGYLRLGQSATTLSGGEAQRIKLANELARTASGRTLYVLDEPTTGLHFHDIAMLLRVLERLRDAGNTIVVIEHNLDVIRAADWIVDLGPEGGSGGGAIVAAGTPREIAASPASHTGRALAAALARAR